VCAAPQVCGGLPQHYLRAPLLRIAAEAFGYTTNTTPHAADGEVRKHETSIYGHRYWEARDRSPIDKPVTAGLVVGSVTTSESLVLNLNFLFKFWILVA
jgi:hypothetical protein